MIAMALRVRTLENILKEIIEEATNEDSYEVDDKRICKISAELLEDAIVLARPQ